MCANSEPLEGEVLSAEEISDRGEAVMFTCVDCGRVVIGEVVRVTEAGLRCAGCDLME